MANIKSFALYKECLINVSSVTPSMSTRQCIDFVLYLTSALYCTKWHASNN